MSAPITGVIPGSIADEMAIEAGDILLLINGQEIQDIIDYQFYSQDDFIVVEIKKTNGELWSLEIDKDWDEELGLLFDDVIFDKMRVCQNRCLFCFVDQLPPGMRKTLSATGHAPSGAPRGAQPAGPRMKRFPRRPADDSLIFRHPPHSSLRSTSMPPIEI